jgi:hypothetical protein
MKLLDLVVTCFPLIFFNELTIKCVVRFGGFVKCSKDSWQLMVEIGLSNRYIIIFLYVIMFLYLLFN